MFLPKSNMTFLKLLMIVVLSNCGGSYIENGNRAPLSKNLKTPDSLILYINAAIDTMQKHSLFTDQVNWDELRNRAINKSVGMSVYADTYPIIESTLASIGDNHSFFKTPNQHSEWLHNDDTLNVRQPIGRMLDDNIAFIQIDHFFSGDPVLIKKFAQDLQTLIKALDANHPKGWIVNLSYNRGGNMWPLLAGIGPLLSDGDLGGFLFPNGNYEPWSYKNGEARIKNELVLKIDNPYKIENLNAPIAILISEKTASSGEAILVSFIGKPNVRTFGSKTAGLSTANGDYTLIDGAQLILTSAVFMDAQGRKYGKTIEPDVDLSDKWYFITGFKQYVMINEAREWIKRECMANDKVFRKIENTDIE